MSTHDHTVDQASCVRAPRAGQVLSLSVDATSRGYDISKLAWNGVIATKLGGRNGYYVSFQCETNDVYIAFDRAAAGTNTIDDTSAIAAGTPLSLPAVTTTGAAPDYIQTFTAAVPPAHIVAGMPPVDIWVDHQIDVTMVVKCAATKTGTLRFWPSSQNRPGAE